MNAVRLFDFLKIRVIPIYQTFDILLDWILIDNGKEYTTYWLNAKHVYKVFLEKHANTISIYQD